MSKTKQSLCLVVILISFLGCSNKETTPEKLIYKLFLLNNNTSIIDVLYGKVDNINVTTSDFMGSKRNTENIAVNGVLQELQHLKYVKKEPIINRPYYLLVFNGQLVKDRSYTFKIFIYVNPDNYNLYLDNIQLNGENHSTVEYNRLYKPNNQMRQYVKEILKVS